MNKIVNIFLDALYPNRCLLCEEFVIPENYFCKDHADSLALELDSRCIGCGLNEKDCECKRFIYHFDGVISPFYHKGNAKNLVYIYKFLKRKRAADFLGKQMAFCVNKYFPKADFDIITSVPRSKLNNEYDHSGFLAKSLSKELGVEYKVLLTASDKERMVQHSLDFNRRFDNVHNAYSVSDTCKNRNVLLVDDIKTSGATIDECARQLKFAGAKSVYCVTATVGQSDYN